MNFLNDSVYFSVEFWAKFFKKSFQTFYICFMCIQISNGYLNRYFNRMVTFVQTLKNICHQKLTRVYAYCGRSHPTPINPIRIQNLCITIVFSPFNSIIKPFQHVGHLFRVPIKKCFQLCDSGVRFKCRKSEFWMVLKFRIKFCWQPFQTFGRMGWWM